MTRAITLAEAQSRHDNWLPRDEPEPRDRHYEQAREELPNATEEQIADRAWQLMDADIEAEQDAYDDHRASRYDD
jgi:hypothetical protein